MNPITRRRFILDAATGLLVPLGMGKIAKASVAILAGGTGFKTQTFNACSFFMDTATGFLSQITGFNPLLFFGRKITITSTAGNYIVAWIGGQSASGETYSSWTTADPTFNNAAKWNNPTGWTIGSGAAVAVSSTHSLYSLANATAGAGSLYEGVFTIATVTGGSVGFRITGQTENGAYQGSVGTYTEYLTSDQAAQQCGIVLGSTFSGSLSSLYIYQVLTPSKGTTPGTYGCILTQTPGGPQGVVGVTGSPYNASSYTVTISAN
jgi:hypothetical protein